MGICKVCKKESPEVCEENPVCWSCGFIREFYNRFTDETMPRPQSKQTEQKLTPIDELNLTF